MGRVSSGPTASAVSPAPSSPRTSRTGSAGSRRGARAHGEEHGPSSSWVATPASRATGWRTRSSSGIHAGGRRRAPRRRRADAGGRVPDDRRSAPDAGVVISASHNPPEYNGIKFFAGDGMKLPDALEDEIEALLGRPAPPAAEGPAARLRSARARERYLAHLVEAAEAPLGGMTHRRRLRERRGVRHLAGGLSSGSAPPCTRSTMRPTAQHQRRTAAPCTRRSWPPAWSAWAPTPGSRTTAMPTARCSPTRPAT